MNIQGAAWSRYSDSLRAGRSGDRILVGARFSAPFQTSLGAHPASCTMGTESFPGVKSSQGVTLTPHPLLVPWSRKSRAIPVLTVRAVGPVQSLSACTRAHCTFTYRSKFWHDNSCIRSTVPLRFHKILMGSGWILCFTVTLWPGVTVTLVLMCEICGSHGCHCGCCVFCDVTLCIW
jgi:hypothetical protein